MSSPSLMAIFARRGRNQVTLVRCNRATPNDKEQPMNSDLVAHSNHLADRRGSHDETTLRDRSANSAAPRLTRRASLMLALVLSLALWTAVWVATGLFASVVLG
jgi:hypothetical protein